MTEVILDASVVVHWVVRSLGRGHAESQQWRMEYDAGRIRVITPSLLFLEVMNVAGRRLRWDESALLELAATIEELQFEVAEPDLVRVAAWVARGLTAYDAAYVALAEERGIDLITDDQEVLAIAGAFARSLILDV